MPAMAGEKRAAVGGDLAALIRGEKGAWDAFVRRYAALIMAAVRGVAQEGGEAEDLAQDVFIRLCKDDFRLLKTYDPARAGSYVFSNRNSSRHSRMKTSWARSSASLPSWATPRTAAMIREA